jgi:putative ABC transport system permease protein
MLWNALVLALREIRRNLLRTALTVLGIVIGVAAVITMFTIGSGATQQVSQQIANLGSNLLIVRPWFMRGPGQRVWGPQLAPGDAAALEIELDTVEAAAPSSNQVLPVIAGNVNLVTTVNGVDNAFFPVRNWAIATGRKFSDAELHAGSSVCILGESVRRELFGDEDPLGVRIRIQRLSCEVIGVLNAKGQSGIGMDQDDMVLVPLRTYWRRIAGNTHVNMIHVTAREGFDTKAVVNDIRSLMRERRRIGPGEEPNFNVLDMQDVAETLTGTTQVLTALLGAVAAVSLLVGGIGIMNIMLVSVTERTREIGTRLAIGAMERDVMMQFLVEAVVLSSIGGLLGIALALGASYQLTSYMEIPFAPDPGIIVLAFLFSAAVGVIFGFFPARRAARLDPIEALRHE